MYDFWYNHLKKQYGDKISLLYTDTDSVIVEVKIEDIYKDMHEHKEDDFSENPENSPYHNKENKGVVGEFKDEFKGATVCEV